MKYFKLIVVSIVLIVSISGCGTPKDTTPPTIQSAVNDNGIVTIGIAEEEGIIKYLISTSSTKPTKDQTDWNTELALEVKENGTYYVFAMDEVGNISEPKEVLVEIESVYERLAKDYDHIAWVINPATEKTVDGVVYNLTELKQQYGDLYPMVEPLSEQEIKDRWNYLVNYLVNEPNTDVLESGLYRNYLVGTFYDDLVEFSKEWKATIAETNDPLLLETGKYYEYSDRLEKYFIPTYNDIFISRESNHGVGLDNIDKVPMKYMDLFVRTYNMSVYYEINQLIINDIEPRFYFDTELDN